MNDSTTVTLINPFEVAEGKVEQAIAMWEQARDFLKTQPGYVSTALHRAVGEGAQFQLINVAQWESVAAFRAAAAKLRTEAGLQPIEGVRGAPFLYTVIRN